tara:strand:+ start:41 stop:1660 length:1620 start_codon:yes stop_codon:yes gene_type:complete
MESLAGNLRQMQRTPLYPEHVEALRRTGREQVFAKGDMIAQAGDRMDTFYYIVEGEVEATDPVTGERHLPTTLGPTQFLGEIAFLNEGAYSFPMRAVRETRMIAVDREPMLELMARNPEMSDIILTVFAARRRRQVEDSDSTLRLIGIDTSPKLRRVAEFLTRNRIPYRALEIGSDEAIETANACDIPNDEPSMILGDNEIIAEPTPGSVAKLLGLDQEVGSREVFDVLIVGGGPAGVASAVYAGAEGLTALLIEDIAIGGQAGTSSRIENYMGFPTGISGTDLVWRGEIQAMKFGTRFAMPRRVTALAAQDDGLFAATLNDGNTVCAKVIIVATGVQYRRLPLKGLERFEGTGIYYAATDIEARYCRETEIIIVGGGNSAGQATMFLSRSAKHVHLLVRGASLAASMSEYLTKRLQADPRITIHYHTEICDLQGDAKLRSVTISDNQSGQEQTISSEAVFVMVGGEPNTDWLAGIVDLDEGGFVITGDACGQISPYAASSPGIFAVGDVRAGSVKRVASAAGEGSVVIAKVWEFIHSQ